MPLHLTRRHALTALGAAGLGGLAAACGTGADGDAAAAEDAAAPDASRVPAGEGATTYPLELVSPFGNTTLEERPSRIAVVSGIQDLEAVLALGAFPVITDEIWTPWQREAMEGHEVEEYDIWADAGLPLEQLLAAAPDLIVATTYGSLDQDFERLAQIAPVLTMESYEDQESWECDWRDVIRRVGLALDLAQTAERVVEETEQLAVDTAAAHPEWQGTTLSFVLNRGEQGGISVSNYTGSVVEEVATSWGFAPQPQADALAAAQGDVSLENLDMIEADLVVIAQHGGHGTPEEAQAWLEANQLYQSLPAVQEGRVAIIEPDEDGTLPIAWGFDYPNALSTPWTVAKFSEAVAPVLG
ncbi:ABC transporter substrate-binding protein [Brachybacterium sp. AOP42-B2-9]|uniref:ABC transporter substrate-binding protein n=1 Tax=Brachybacterium sp. AOP42-B2-9 TaxID=3457672 RepID=UPI004033965C